MQGNPAVRGDFRASGRPACARAGMKARRTAMITGWTMEAGATYRRQCYAAFPLSDHADFPDLLRFADLVQPRRVLTPPLQSRQPFRPRWRHYSRPRLSRPSPLPRKPSKRRPRNWRRSSYCAPISPGFPPMTRRPPAWQRGPDGQGSREHLHPGRRGLADVEIAQLTAHFLAHTLEVHGRYRTVVPDTVLEIAFDSIQPSGRHQSGYALRFPQIVRIRPDKTPAEIDTLETCRRLAAASFADASASREAAS